MKQIRMGCAVLALFVGGCDRDPERDVAMNPASEGPGGAGASAGAASSEAGSSAPVARDAGVAGSAGSAGSAAANDGGEAVDPELADAAAPIDAGGEDGWETIISADWELEPNQERYFCQRSTLTEDLYINAIKAINPLGTHHTALTAAETGVQPDGLAPCTSRGLEPQGIFGSGVGTEPVTYPPGVGLRLRAGQQLLLNLHVFNVTGQPMTGTSGTAIRRTEPSEVVHVAESLLAGPVNFSIPGGGQTTVDGQCTMTHDVTLFAVQPHMHQTGVHMKGIAMSSTEGEVVLHDGAFDFEEQLVYSIEPVAMKKGDVVRVQCTFENEGATPIAFGESSNQEMCFLVLHRYPASDTPSVSCYR